MIEVDKAIFKFNNGYLALVCSECSFIIKEGKDFNSDESLACTGDKYLEPQFCIRCLSPKSITSIKVDENKSNSNFHEYKLFHGCKSCRKHLIIRSNNEKIYNLYKQGNNELVIDLLWKERSLPN